MRSSKNVSSNTQTCRQMTDSEWDNAIHDAETELKDVQKRARQLKFALAVFRQQKSDGVPWPGKAASE